MNSTLGEKYVEDLRKLFDHQGLALYSGHHVLCLTVPCLDFLQHKFSSLQESSGDPLPPSYVNLQHLQECLSRIMALKLIVDRQHALPAAVTLNLAPFKALRNLILRKIPLHLVTGLQRLRGQLQSLAVQRCQVGSLEDVIVRCGGDDSASFAWNSLKELDLSNNSITSLGDCLQYLLVLEKVNFSNNSIGTSTEGIESIDSLTFLHLGFNKLSSVPVFGSRARYNLRQLNLRNNQLENIDGLEVLDSLVELELTDNLLSQHSKLKPLRNMHHLKLLSLQGNPLCYHHRHRLNTAGHLSNIMSKSEFRLDGRKLTAAEKKAISHSMTHYTPAAATGGQAALGVPRPPFLEATLARSMPDERGLGPSPESQFFHSVPNHPKITPKKKRSLRPSHTAEIEDSDEEASQQPQLAETHTVPLMHEEQLDQLKQLRNQVDDKWLISTNSLEASYTTADDSTSSGLLQGRGTSQPPPPPPPAAPVTTSQQDAAKPKSSSSSSTKSSRSHRERLRNKQQHSADGHTVVRGDEGVGGAGGCEGVEGMGPEAELEGVFGPRTSSPVERAQTPGTTESGDCFLVERYESDMEDDESSSSGGGGGGGGARKESEQVFIVVSERFLEEKNTQGRLLDRWDLHCLKAASIGPRPRKTMQGKDYHQQSEVLVLQFNLERRDRCRREYVLLEPGASFTLLELLEPVVEQNHTTLSMGNRLECLHCQHVFDMSEAMDQPSDEPQPLSSSSTFASRRRSLSRLMCPLCHSQILQYSMPRSLISHSPKPSPSDSNKSRPDAPLITVMASKETSNAGFSINNSVDGSLSSDFNSPLSKSAPLESRSVPFSALNSSRGPEKYDGSRLYKGEDFAAVDTGRKVTQVSEEEYSVGSRVMNGTKTPEDSYDQHDPFQFRMSPYTESQPNSDTEAVPKSRGLTSSEPYIPSRPAVAGGDNGLPFTQAEIRRHSSALEETLKPWQSKKGNSPGRPHTNQRVEEEIEIGRAPQLLTHLEAPTLSSDTPQRSTNPFDVEPDENPSIPVHSATEDNVNSVPGVSESLDRSSQSTTQPESSGRDQWRGDSPSQFELSYSMPSEGAASSHSTLLGGAVLTDSESDKSGHSRSKSADFHPAKKHQVSPPIPRKYKDPFLLTDPASPLVQSASTSQQSSNRTSRNSSRKSSIGSLDSGESPISSRRGSPKDYSSGERLQRSRRGSSEKLLLSGEAKYSSKLSGGFSSGDFESRSSKRKISTSSDKHSSDKHSSSSSEWRASSSGGGGGGGRVGRGKTSSSSGGQRKLPGSKADSRDAAGGDSQALFKEENPEYIHNSLHIHFELEVFKSDDGEKFQMIFKSPVVQYGHSREMPSLCVISNLTVYIYRITAPESSHFNQWLELVAEHPLNKLVYIDISVGYQFLRMEFSTSGACYSFLMRSEDKCTKCSTKLAYLAAEVPKSHFRTVGVCPFSVDTIRHPERMLREVVLTQYAKIDGRLTPTKGLTSSLHHRDRELSQASDDELKLYLLAHQHSPGKTHGKKPVTLVLTATDMFLATENFQQWPIPHLQDLPRKQDLNPPYLDVQCMEITDIEQIVLDRDQSCHVVMRFFKESVSEGESVQWSLIMHDASSVGKLVSAVQKPWESQFETTLPIVFK